MSSVYYKIKRKKLKIISLIIFSIFLAIFFQTAYQNSNNLQNISSNSKDLSNQEAPHTSASTSYNNIQWLENTDFSNPSINPWLNTTSGDSSDIEAGVSTGQADIVVKGENGTKEISDVFATPTDWKAFNKSDTDLYPDNIYVDSTGVYVDHFYDEDPNQFPIVYWRYNVSMGLDMSDYEITSASIKAKMNASVDPDFDVLDDTVSHPGDDVDSRDLMDSIYFTVEVSDMNVLDKNTYLIANNKTYALGYDGGAGYYETETDLTPKPQQDIGFYIDRVLEADTEGHNNFTIILGIAIDCADNSDAGDEDEVLYARIKDLNLTFTYEKKIDKYTTLSWYQEGVMINYTSVQITDAQLDFQYKINKDWNDTTSSQFSEFRIYINNKMQVLLPNTKLVDYDYSTNQGNLIDIRVGGYDLTNLIPLEENITLSIQVYLGDNFELDQPVSISIDNVDFMISYIVFYNATGRVAIIGDDDGKGSVTEEPWLFLIIAIIAIVGGVCLGAYLVAYELFLKYPKPVRKVRKYRKTLKKKEGPSVEIKGRKQAFNSIYKSKSDLLSGMKGKPKAQIIEKKLDK